MLMDLFQVRLELFQMFSFMEQILEARALSFGIISSGCFFVNCAPDVERPEAPRGAAGAPCRSTSATGAAQKPAVVMVLCQVCRRGLQRKQCLYASSIYLEFSNKCLFAFKAFSKTLGVLYSVIQSTVPKLRITSMFGKHWALNYFLCFKKKIINKEE